MDDLYNGPDFSDEEDEEINQKVKIEGLLYDARQAINYDAFAALRYIIEAVEVLAGID